MGKYNAKAILAGLGGTVSTEDNDLNINIQAEHEGDGDENEGSELGAFDNSEVPAEPTPVETPVETEALAVDTSGVPETAELDVVDAQEGTGEVVDKIEEVSDVSEGLESIAIQLATISAEGIEVTPFIANTINRQYDYVVRNFPKMNRAALGTASFESFGGVEVVSLETVADKLREGGKAIVAWLRQLWEKIKAFLGSGKAAGGVIKSKANALAGQKAGEAPANVAVPEFLRQAGVSTASVKQLTTLVKNLADARYAELLTSLNQGNDPVTAMRDANKAIFSGVGSLTNVLGGFALTVTPDGVSLTPSKAAAVDGEKIKPLSESEAHAIAKANAELGEAIVKYAGFAEVRKTITDNMIKILAKDGQADDAGWLKRHKAAKAAAKLWGRQQAFEQQTIKKAIAAGNAVNNVIAASLGKAGKAEK